MEFLVKITEGLKPSTKKLKYSLLKSLFNFVKNTAEPDLSNPCDSAVLAKTFRVTKLLPWTILERDAVDELIFKTESPRNRLMLELMARGGMRIGEVLKLKPQDVQDRKLHLPNPKSGRASEVVFIPQKVADRLREYVAAENILDDEGIFPLGYTRTREIVKNAGKKIGGLIIRWATYVVIRYRPLSTICNSNVILQSIKRLAQSGRSYDQPQNWD